jgi:hypothetical protein
VGGGGAAGGAGGGGRRGRGLGCPRSRWDGRRRWEEGDNAMGLGAAVLAREGGREGGGSGHVRG